MTLNELYRETVTSLRRAGMENAAYEAACLFEKHTGIPRYRLPLCGEREANGVEPLRREVRRRCEGEPLQYLLGEWEFMGLPFRVGPGVLIPRPETELLAQEAVDFLRRSEKPHMLELCGGSGCVSVSAAKQVPGLEVFCLEYSGDAIRYLEENIRLNNVQDSVHVLRGDMLRFERNEHLPAELDAIVCNPPYIPSGDIGGLQVEVRVHEPRAALDGGPDGLAFYRAFAPWVSLLRHGGMAVFEVGAGQAADAADILRGAGLQGVFIRRDFSGIERVTGGFRP